MLVCRAVCYVLQTLTHGHIYTLSMQQLKCNVRFYVADYSFLARL